MLQRYCSNVAANLVRQSIRVYTRIEQTIFCFDTIVNCAYIYGYVRFGFETKTIGERGSPL